MYFFQRSVGIVHQYAISTITSSFMDTQPLYNPRTANSYNGIHKMYAINHRPGSELTRGDSDDKIVTIKYETIKFTEGHVGYSRVHVLFHFGGSGRVNILHKINAII